MAKAGTTTWGVEFLPEVNRQGLATITKSVRKALEAGTIGKTTADSFQKMAENAAKGFNDIIGQAKMYGFRREADLYRRKMDDAQKQIVEAINQLDGIHKQRQEAQEKQDRAALERLADEERLLKEKLENASAVAQREMEATEKLIRRRKMAIEELEELTATESAAAFGEGIRDALGSVKSADLQGFTGMIVSGIKGGGEALGARGAMMAAGGGGMAGVGTALTSIAAMAAPIAAIAGALAVVVKLMLDADAQAKEFNSTILQAASGADLGIKAADQGLVRLEDRLDGIREMSFGLAWQWRMLPKEILEIVSAANEANLTYKEMQDIMSTNVDEMTAYAEVTRVAIVYSKQLGQSTTDIAQQTAEWVHDLGMGLQQVEEGFTTIFMAAQQSGIGVKQFYTMVTNATSNMALYNVRVAEAAALIKELGEGLGEATGAEFVAGLAAGFAEEGYTERFKSIIIAGQDDVREIMTRSAESTATEFARRMSGREGIPAAIDAAFESAGITGVSVEALGDPEQQLAQIERIAGMSEEQIRMVLTRVRGQDAQAARQLETMIRLSKGVEGGLGEQAKALDDLDMGGKLAMMLQTLGDTPLSEMSAIQLAAFEQYAGISGKQLKQLQIVDSQLRGNYEELQRQSELSEEQRMTQEEMIEQFGAYIDKDGKIVTSSIDASGEITERAVEDVGDYIQSQGDTLAAAVEGGMDAQEAMAQEIVSNTADMSARLQTGVQWFLEKIYDAMDTIIQLMSKDTQETRDARVEAIEQSKVREEALRDMSTSIAAEMSQTRVAYDKATGEEREELGARLDELATAQQQVELGMGKEREMQRLIRTATGESAAAVTASAEDIFLASESAQRVATGVVGADEAAALTEELRQLRERGGEAGTLALAQEGSEIFPSAEDIAASMLEGEELIQEMSEKTDASLFDGQTDALTDAQQEQFTDWKREYPKLTERAFLDALELAAMRELVGSIGGTPEQQQDLMRRLRGGGTLTPAEVATLTEEAAAKAAMLGVLGAGGAAAAGYGAGGGPGPGVGGEEFIWANPPESVPEDFIFRAGGGVTPFHTADDIIGGKAGGPLAEALAGRAGGTVNITINGGDTARIYDVVKKAMRESGVRPEPGRR